MTDQPAFVLTRSCRECGAEIPWDGGPGRPRVYCDGCRPAEWAPLRGERINQSVSRTVVVREHLRRVKGDTSPIPRHRISDPPSSRTAARKVAGQGVEREILEVFGRHPAGLTDDELAACLPDRFAPTVKTARSRLARNGYLHDTGLTRPSARGHQQIVWRIA